MSGPSINADSTSDDSSSSAATEDNDLLILENCRPLVDLMPGLKSSRRFVIDACAGLSGTETLHQFACIFDEGASRFYVWLGDTDFAFFTKSSFMNLCNFAEELGAQSVTFLVYHQHRHKTQYRGMFRVIDAKRLGSDAVKELIGAQDKQAAKSVIATTLFYELAL